MNPPPHRTVVEVIIRPEYMVGYEQRGDTTYVHCMVIKWSPSVARRFMKDCDAAQLLLGRTVYALDDPNKPLLRKFILKSGFRPLTRTLDIHGRNVEVFERPIQDAYGRRNLHQHSPE